MKMRVLIAAALAVLVTQASPALAESYPQLLADGYKATRLTKHRITGKAGWELSSGAGRYFCPLRGGMVRKGGALGVLVESGALLMLDKAAVESTARNMRLDTNTLHAPPHGEVVSSHPPAEFVGRCRKLR